MNKWILYFTFIRRVGTLTRSHLNVEVMSRLFFCVWCRPYIKTFLRWRKRTLLVVLELEEGCVMLDGLLTVRDRCVSERTHDPPSPVDLFMNRLWVQSFRVKCQGERYHVLVSPGPKAPGRPREPTSKKGSSEPSQDGGPTVAGPRVRLRSGGG